MMRRQSDDTESQVHPIIAQIPPLNTNSKMYWKSYGTFLIANTMQSNSVVFLLKKYNLSTDQWSEMPKSL